MGKSGDSAALPLLDTLTETNEKDYIKRLTLDVCLTLAKSTDNQQLVEILKNTLPDKALEILTKKI